MNDLLHGEGRIQADRADANSKFPLFTDLFAKDFSSTRGQQIYDRWKAWHEANPRFWNLFVKFTFDLINAGHQHGSADMICHRIRWESALELNSREPVRVNNDYTSLWARLFAAQHPQHSEFFRRRRRISEDKPAHVIDSPVTDYGPPVREAGLQHQMVELAHQRSPNFHRP